MSDLVAVNRRVDEMVVYAMSKTDAGFWIMNGHYVVLSVPVSSEGIGRTVADALGRSEQGVPTPSPHGNDPFTSVMRALGVRNYRQYLAGARSVVVEQVGTVIAVIARKNTGARNGFVELPETACELVTPTNGELGSCVLATLEKVR